MGTFLVYILKSSLCLALFYLFYRLLLSKETFHRFNRIALLGVMLISCLLPLVRVTVDRATVVNTSVMLVEEDMLMYPWEMQTVVQEEAAFPWREWLVAVYLLGIFFFLLRNLWSLVRMLYLIRHSRCRQMENGICLVIHQAGFAPFSWMKYIVISQTDLDENGTDILIHEEAHIRNRHSLDLLLVELCIWLQWFNPAAWLLKQELQNVHEYEADEAVLRQGIDAKRYQMLLIKKAVGARLYSIANSFNHSSLKKRITMMLKEKSSPQARAKYIYILPLAALSVMAFARPEVSDASAVLTKAKVTDLWTIPQEKTPEVKAQFPGGENKFFRFIYQNFKYPTLALEAGKQGRVACLVTIGQDGNVNDVEITTSVDPALDAEVIRVMKKMPKWEPAQLAGKAIETKIPLGILFKIDGSDLKTENDNDIVVVGANESPNNRPALEVRGKGNPIYVIDGKICTKETFEKMTPDKINAVHILKPEEAIQKYGEQAKDGAILIITKQNKSDMKFYPATTDETSQKEAMKQYGEQARNGAPLIKLRSNPQ